MIFTYFLTSCSHEKIAHYNYNSVTITRVDKEAESNFYYGDVKPTEVKNITKCIHVEFHGLNNGMDLFMVFKPNKTVEFINYGLGNIAEMGGKNKNIFIAEYDNGILDSVLNKYKTENFGFIRMSDSKEVEYQWANENHCNVSVNYE